MAGGPAYAQSLERGDLVVADRQGTGPARLVQIERATGRQKTLYVSYDGVLVAPRDIEIDAERRIVASQSATPLRPAAESVVRFDPATGSATLLSAGALLSDIDGIAIAPDGAIFAADHGNATGTPPAVVRIDAANGAQQLVTSGGMLVRPVDVAVASDGTIFVLDTGTGSGARLIRVDPASGAQTEIAAPGRIGHAAAGVAIDADGAVVALAAFGSLVRVTLDGTSIQPIAGGPGQTSTDLAIEPDGDALVLLGSGADRLDRVDRATGTASTLASGFTSPMGVAVVPATQPFCDVEVGGLRYADGETVSISTLRLVNPGSAPFATRLRLSLAIPGLASPIVLVDFEAALPARLDAELAPISFVTVHAGLPRGTYQLRCAFEDPVGGAVQDADAVPFVLE